MGLGAGCGDGATGVEGADSLHALAPTTTATIVRAEIARRHRIERSRGPRSRVGGKSTGICGIVVAEEKIKRYAWRKGYPAW
jgi:hypothetical protein